MVKGLRSPDPMQLDLMRTYSAADCADLREAALAVEHAVPVPEPEGRHRAVAWSAPSSRELPTGAQAGLGARLLAGSYYGQTIQIWAALFMSAFLAVAAVGAVGLAERG